MTVDENNGFAPVNERWAANLVHKLSARGYITILDQEMPSCDEVQESTLQDITMSSLVQMLPKADVKKREFSIRDILKSETNLRADIAIFKPWALAQDRDALFTIAEIKRAYADTSNINSILQDIARLAIISHKLQFSTYLIFCGRPENVVQYKKDHKLLDYLSFVEANSIEIDLIKLGEELNDTYKHLIKKSGVNSIQIDCCAISEGETGKYSAYIWRIESDFNCKNRDQLQYYVVSQDFMKKNYFL